MKEAPVVQRGGPGTGEDRPPESEKGGWGTMCPGKQRSSRQDSGGGTGGATDTEAELSQAG